MVPTRLHCTLAILLSAHFSFSQFSVSGAPRGQKPPVIFTENKGQVRNQHHQPRHDILYSGQAGNMAFFVRNNGISYQLSRVDSWMEAEQPKLPVKRKVPGQMTVYRLDVTLLGARPAKASGKIRAAGQPALLLSRVRFGRACREAVQRGSAGGCLSRH